MTDFVPVEVVEMILAHLEAKDLHNCRYVNRDWNLVCCKYLTDLHNPVKFRFVNRDRSAIRFVKMIKTSSQPFLFSKFEFVLPGNAGAPNSIHWNGFWPSVLAEFAENCGELGKHYKLSGCNSSAGKSEEVTKAVEYLVNLSPNIEYLDFSGIKNCIVGRNLTTPLPKLKEVAELTLNCLEGILLVAPNLQKVTASITEDSDWTALSSLKTLQCAPVFRLDVTTPPSNSADLIQLRELNLRVERLEISYHWERFGYDNVAQDRLQNAVDETKKWISSLTAIKELNLDYRLWAKFPATILEKLESITLRAQYPWVEQYPAPMPVPFCPLLYPNLSSIPLNYTNQGSLFNLSIPFTGVTSLSLYKSEGMNLKEKFPDLKSLELSEATVEDFGLIFTHAGLTDLNLGNSREAWDAVCATVKDPGNGWMVVRRNERVDTFMRGVLHFNSTRKCFEVEAEKKELSYTSYLWSVEIPSRRSEVHFHRFEMDEEHELVKQYLSTLTKLDYGDDSCWLQSTKYPMDKV